eukprot:scaffold64420_cov37-Tisochrysis_lutea.AAC.2
MAPKKKKWAAAEAACESAEASKKQKTAPKEDKPAKTPALKVPEGPIQRSETPRTKAAAGCVSALHWNVGGLNSVLTKPDKTELLRLLVAEEKPTLISFSEHKLSAEKLDMGAKALAAELPGYTSAHWAVCTVKKGYSGVAVFVRDGEEVLSVRLDDVCDLHEGRSISIELKDMWVVSVYVPNSGQNLDRLNYRIDTWDPALAAHAASLEASGKPIVLIGDMNVAPLDADIWNYMAKHIPKSAGTTPQERASFARLVGEPFGEDGVVPEPYDTTLVDAFRHLHPEARGKSPGFGARGPREQCLW